MQEMKKTGAQVRRAALPLPPCVQDELDPANGSAARTSDHSSDGCCRRNQLDMPGQGPDLQAQDVAVLVGPCRVVGEIHRVVFVDGIWIARDLVVLIACSELRPVFGTSPAPRRPRLGGRCSRASPPDMVVTDGGPGSPRQRLEGVTGDEFKMHFPRVLPGKEEDDQEAESAGGKRLPYALAEGIAAYRDPPSSRLVGRKVHVNGASSGRTSSRTSIVDGRKVYTHGRIREARSGLTRLVSKGVLFTYLGRA